MYIYISKLDLVRYGIYIYNYIFNQCSNVMFRVEFVIRVLSSLVRGELSTP